MTIHNNASGGTPTSAAGGRWVPDEQWLWLVASWLICAAYMYGYLMRGWVPHDEGALALSAERILGGEVPHKDFDELYTGGLSYWHALAFLIFGVKLAALRWAVFAGFLAWLPAIFAIAKRFTSFAGAAGMTAIAAVWSVPNYAASMPSWYNLFFATFGIVAIFRFLESKRYSWLLVAGACGGISVCIKTSGLYFVGAVLLFLIYCEQNEANDSTEDDSRFTAYSIVLCLSTLLLIFFLFRMVQPLLSVEFFAHFVLPGSAIALAILWRELAATRSKTRIRLNRLLRTSTPFLLGVLLPIFVLLLPYIRTRAVATLVRGVFVAPLSRLVFASRQPIQPDLAGYVLLGVVCAVLAVAILADKMPVLVPPLVGLIMLYAVIVSRHYIWLYRGLWFAISSLVPLTVLFGSIYVELYGSENKAEKERTFLLLAVLGLSSLIQFPFSAPVYFLYIAPLLFLAVRALPRRHPETRQGINIAIGIPLLLFAVLRVTPGFIFSMGGSYAKDSQKYRLLLPRASGLRVSPAEGEVYDQLVPATKEHSLGGRIYAGPDSPQIYFLSGNPNPTGTSFDFLADPEKRDAAIKQVLVGETTRVAVIRTEPDFSAPLSPALQDLVRKLYPNAQRFGPFELRWR